MANVTDRARSGDRRVSFRACLVCFAGVSLTFKTVAKNMNTALICPAPADFVGFPMATCSAPADLPIRFSFEVTITRRLCVNNLYYLH